ncbi:3-dehydroquinate dehydratase-2 [Constrictibacter sp. MBR-5]|jgi:3-dehydroquinate dehydratase-2|uniref:type II 3-dehydroquinate dehydratase n=1 Tax=Constrictibacter sp. MBR-5 TaxID=3156467 RepID=UPI003396FEAC
MADAVSILLVQGANMNWLGRRQPELYGTMTATELDAMLLTAAAARGCRLDIFYTNIEGVAVDRIYAAAEAGCHGLLMNPAGFLLGGHALADCLRAVRLPYVEVHMTNIERRGRTSVMAETADGMIAGLGPYAYILGLDGLMRVIAGRMRETEV